MSTQQNNLRAVGMNDEQTECDLCGRVELRGTVIIADVAEGVEVGRYGTTCASKVLGVRVTRRTALADEAYRRHFIVDEIRRGRAALAAGNWPKVAIHVRDARRGPWLPIRADEIAALDALETAIAEHAPHWLPVARDEARRRTA